MSAQYSKEAQELAAVLDKNASIEQMLATIDYHAKVIATANRWIEAYMCHLNTTVIPRFVKENIQSTSTNHEQNPDA